jgi:hypothetical protein
MAILCNDPAAREAFIAGLRALADLLAANPAVPVPQYGESILLTTHGDDAENRAAVEDFAAVTGASVVDDRWDSEGIYSASCAFGPVEYRAIAHSAACMAEYHARQDYARSMQYGTAGLDEFSEAA